MKAPSAKAPALPLASWESQVGSTCVPRRTKVEAEVESLHTTILLVTEKNDTSWVTPTKRFTGAKRNKTVGLKTSAQGHWHQSSNPLWAALHFVISVSVDIASDSINTILLLPSACEWCQRNQLEKSLSFKWSKSLWGWVSDPLSYTAEYSVFTLFQMGPDLKADNMVWLHLNSRKVWWEMVCNCEWCLYYFKYGSTGYHSLLALVNKPSQNEIRTVAAH